MGKMHFLAADDGARLGRGALNPDLFLDPAWSVGVQRFLP